MAWKADQADLKWRCGGKSFLYLVRLGLVWSLDHEEVSLICTQRSWPILISACIFSRLSSSHNFAYVRHYLCSQEVLTVRRGSIRRGSIRRVGSITGTGWMGEKAQRPTRQGHEPCCSSLLALSQLRWPKAEGRHTDMMSSGAMRR